MNLFITNSNSMSSSNDTSTTHTKSHDESYVFTLNSEDSHSRSDGGSHKEGDNWAFSNELSHHEEYNRMTMEDFNNVVKRSIEKTRHKYNDNHIPIIPIKNNIGKLYRRGVLDKVVGGLEKFAESKTGKNVGKILNFAGKVTGVVDTACNVGQTIAAFQANSIAREQGGDGGGGNNIQYVNTGGSDGGWASKESNQIAKAANRIAEKGNMIASEGNQIAREGNQIAREGNQIAREGNQIAREGNEIAREGNQIAREGNQIAREGNEIAREGNQIAREANDIAKVSNDIAREGNYIAREANDIARDANNIAFYANIIAERGIESQENIAKLDRELQIQLANENAALQVELNEAKINNDINIALAGTRSTSTDTTNGSSRGGSISDSTEWSDTYTSSSGVSNSWSNTDGISDAYLTGHTENVSSEHAQADTISNIVTNAYTSENGWKSEEGFSNTFSTVNTHGKTTTSTNSNTQSINKSKQMSINNSIEKSQSISKTYDQSIIMDYNPTAEGCYKPALIPKLKTEVTIWACGNKNENGKTSVSYHKVYDVVEAHVKSNDKMSALIPCEANEDDYYERYNPFNNDMANADYYSEPSKRNAIISGMALSAGEYISGKNKKWYFGLLEDGTLALTQGSFSKRTVRWSTRISNINEYNPLFEIGNNGHLIITVDADNIFNSEITNEEEIKKYIKEKYTNTRYDDIFVDNEELKFSNTRVIVWDSLPKHLPYNVGYYESIGYTLILNDESDNDNVRLTLYDEVGIKIWEIYKNGKGTNFPNYIGYAFPYEYNIPLNNDMINISDQVSDLLANNAQINSDKKDLHLKLDKKIVDKYDTYVLFGCETVLNENEALVSENGIYRFILQSTGNLVLKEGKRTLWSSLTSNINGFTGPYKLSLSPKGELILRDKYNFVVWQTYNPTAIDNADEGIDYVLALSDEGELQIISSELYKIWSSLPFDNINNHTRYKALTVYNIDECSEKNRVPFNYYIFSNYHVYEKSEEKSVRKRDGRKLENYYYNNVLPHEKIISIYNSVLEISDNQLILITDTNDEVFEYKNTIAECPKDTKIEELVLDNTSLYLICNNKEKVTLGTFTSSDYYKLEIRYDNYLFEAVLVVIDTNTKLVEWSSESVRYLNYIEETITYDRNNRIITDNTITTYDRLYSITDKNSFVYMSNEYGLQLKSGSFDTIRELSIIDNNMLINGIPFIKNITNMRIHYDGKNDKIVNQSNGDKIIWELYDNKKCDQIISNNDDCNILYTMSDIILENITLRLVPLGLYINNHYIDMTQYIYEENVEEKKFYYETIYSLKLTNEGSLILNDKITVFENTNTSNPPFRLDVIDNNLYVRNSVNQFLWSTSDNYPSGNSAIKDTIKNGEKLNENEIFKCKNFSVEIYNGKLYYNKDNNLESMYNTYRYISYIYLTPEYVLIYDKHNEVIDALYETKDNNDKMFIRCDDVNDSFVLDDGNGKILWSYPDNREFCGPDHENKTCSNNQCCGKDGICGNTSDYCGIGCQLEFGKCDIQYCGPNHENAICPNNLCCNKDGVCGNTIDFCDIKKGCQEKFGICSLEGRCGKDIGKCKNSFECCNKDGYCGTDDNFCSVDNCQSEFGFCNNKDIPYEWISWDNTKTDSFPENTISLKNSVNETLIIGRAIDKNLVHPGYVDVTSKKLHVPYNDQELTYEKYEILICDSDYYQWKKYNRNIKPTSIENRIIGGYDDNGKELGIAKCKNELDGAEYIGKYSTFYFANYVYNNEEQTTDEFDVLMYLPKSSIIRCGKNYDNNVCPGDQCCGKNGICGTDEEYCSVENCDIDFGKCTNGGRCGKEFGKCLNPDECCNKDNYCGASEDYCNPIDCQPEFGKCSIPTISGDVKPVWIYNPSTNKCISLHDNLDGELLLEDCDNDNAKWLISSNEEKYIYPINNIEKCLQLVDASNGKIKVSDCVGGVASYRFKIESGYIYSSTSANDCIGVGDKKNENTIYLKSCEKSNDQLWEIHEDHPFSNRCGTKFGGKKCSEGQCCNKDGFCGITADFCSPTKGCQLEYGECKCGTEFGKCPSDTCCNKDGKCGTTEDYCKVDSCSPEFGKCDLPYEWVKMTDDILQSLIYLTSDNNKITIGRGKYKNGIYPGYVNMSDKKLYITYEGVSIKLDEYEVLNLKYKQNLFWKKIEDVNPNEILYVDGGNDSEGKKFAVTRCRDVNNKYMYFGKSNDLKITTYSADEKEKSNREFDVLAYSYKHLDSYSWNKWSGSLPENAVSMKTSIDKTFAVIRSTYLKTIQPGYMNVEANKSYISYNGGEVNVDNNDIEVLTCSSEKYYWKKIIKNDPYYSFDQDNDKYIPGGNEKAMNVGIAKCIHKENNSEYYGKTYDFQIAYYAYNGKEYATDEFEILINAGITENEEIDNSKTQNVWIYNEKSEKCLGHNGNGKPVKLSNCFDSLLWEIPVNGAIGFYRLPFYNLCLRISDEQSGSLVLGSCDENAIMESINESNKSIKSVIFDNKCVSASNNINLEECKSNDGNQQWSIYTTNPYNGRCGSKFNRTCPDNNCCSRHNWCGTTEEFCGIGCQDQFGLCK